MEKSGKFFILSKKKPHGSMVCTECGMSTTKTAYHYEVHHPEIDFIIKMGEMDKFICIFRNINSIAYSGLRVTEEDRRTVRRWKEEGNTYNLRRWAGWRDER